MRILKFGGSSLATPERLQAVAAIVAGARQQSPVAVVVSAFGGVTDRLLEASHLAATGSDGYRPLLADVARRHRQAVAALANRREVGALEAGLEEAWRELGHLLQGVRLLKEVSPRIQDSILSYGERLSSRLVAATFQAAGLEATACDARELIVSDATFGAAQVHQEATNRQIRTRFSEAAYEDGTIAVVTGFIAATQAGETTTLGRGGSDYTASLLGAALEADAVELWTDVDGVMNADPRLVAAAQPIATLSYDELMELSHFGAKVVYPPSVHPSREADIPLYIRNTLRPEAPGTFVHSAAAPGDGPVCGIASIANIALLRLEGDGMVGVPGIAMRLFATLARRRVSVILITQASSEHSICFGVAPPDLKEAMAGVAEEFALERKAGLIDALVQEKDLAVVAVVGRGMRDSAGLAGRLFSVLGEQGISVRAIAQGSSELNISLVVASQDERRAVNALHAACFPGLRTAEIYLVGAGNVGAALLRQIAEHREDIETRRGLRLVLAAVAGRRACLAAEQGLEPAAAAADLRSMAATESDSGAAKLLQQLNSSGCPKRVFVDCTASTYTASLYAPLLSQGVAVVAANKIPFAGPFSQFRSLLQTGPGRVYFEATVGAGLPVVRTIQDLVSTGDGVRRIEGLLSGTLSYVFDQVRQGLPFSQAVRQAHDQGFTEPDPRQDLNGQDVARKLLILARLARRNLEPEQIELETLLPEGFREISSLEEFWRRLPELDTAFQQRSAAAQAAGQRLCYLAILDDEGARVGLELVPESHPCATVQGQDNLVAITTDRYSSAPMVIRGPGAGPEVTAGGVFADLLRAIDEAPNLAPLSASMKEEK